MNTLDGTAQSPGLPPTSIIPTALPVSPDSDRALATQLDQDNAGIAHPPQTYGTYLRVPELLGLQAPFSAPPRHDEMLFIITQQVQELWFKQILFEIELVISLLNRGELPYATRLMARVNKIIGLLGAEAGILETMPPSDFLHFRSVLTTASGFESEQFRELEYASGLREPTFINIIEKHMDAAAVRARWPQSLHQAFLGALHTSACGVRESSLPDDPTDTLLSIYLEPDKYPALFALAESMSEYELHFLSWRFAHVKLVERVIGSRTQGTAGSAGHGYLGKTLQYRFFPELWEARNLLSEHSVTTIGA